MNGRQQTRPCARPIVYLAIALVSAACGNPEFALPPGKIDAGKATFVELRCASCHSVAGQIKHAPDTDGAIHVELGGTVSRIKTYEDLVTSIINPSHKLSRGLNTMTATPEGLSRMPVYNDIMTVQQLVDLTAFLETTYEVWVPPYSDYQYP
jgi:sulfur-oxidizing protein SoxX